MYRMYYRLSGMIITALLRKRKSPLHLLPKMCRELSLGKEYKSVTEPTEPIITISSIADISFALLWLRLGIETEER